jgi:thymidylate synthase ThyX
VKETETRVQVIADSIRWDCWPYCPPVPGKYNDSPGRIITVQMRYPRWIHSEFMTHRDRARNAASSRAVSVKKSLSNNTFRPKDIPSEQRGMNGGDGLSLDHKRAAYGIIEQMAQFAVASCTALAQLGVHKSIVNRYLEPFAYIDVVCTATRWDHFLSLRDHPDAEPHFRELAGLLRQALDNTGPIASDFHLPYVDRGELSCYPVDKCLHVSAARCAGISYKRPDFGFEKELEVCAKLVTNRHSSPLEHPGTSKDVAKDFRSGPMVGWKTLRTILQQD